MAGKTSYPKITTVRALPGNRLLVGFDNGVTKTYDCTSLLETEAFRSLFNDAFFRLAHPDAHGYGVIWNDDVDLAESEIWVNGQVAEQGS